MKQQIVDDLVIRIYENRVLMGANAGATGKCKYNFCLGTITKRIFRGLKLEHNG
jgi:hypothetical protein